MMSRDTSESSSWFSVGDNEVRLLRNGSEAFPRMLEAIARARREVLLEMYWIGPDKVGIQFRDALTECARRGVKIHVIYDALGSLTLTPSWWDPLLHAGGIVRAFNSIRSFFPMFAESREAFRLEQVMQRDHRKLLVVDRSSGFIGGINLALQWSPRDEGGEEWRDDMIELRGPIASSDLTPLFYKTWRRILRHHVAPEVGPFPPRSYYYGRFVNDAPKVKILTSQRRRKRTIYREYIARINSARSSIAIANPYFVPDRGTREALYRAALRGVRVRLLLPEQNDVRVVQFAMQAKFESLLERGIEIYLLPPPMMHAKTAIFDESFVTVGSYNFDERSLRTNLEANAFIEDDAFAKYVLGSFETDIQSANRLELKEWQHRTSRMRGVEWLAFAMRELW